MPSNIEIKARLSERVDVEARIVDLADGGPETLRQDDTFFPCRFGRLKLRVFASGEGELIYYRRADRAGPKKSYYVVTPASDPDGLREALTLAYRTAGRVRKVRTLYRIGRTRVHLDRVEGLGDFLELEVVLEPEEAAAGGMAEALDLLKRLAIPREALIEGAYVDLLRARASRPGRRR